VALHVAHNGLDRIAQVGEDLGHAPGGVHDVEVIFLFPWAVKYAELGLYGLVTMFVFLGILLIGYVWIYKKGALEWV